MAALLGGIASGATRTEPLPRLPLTIPHLPTHENRQVDKHLATLGEGFDGWAGFYIANLKTGHFAEWNSTAIFPAASTVKIGLIAEAIRHFGVQPGSSVDADLRAIGTYSSNSAADDVYYLVGGTVPTEAALRRLGMFSSTFPGPYTADAVTSDDPDPPPQVHWRVTTARDLGRALFRLQAAAAGQRWAIRQTELTKKGAQAALGYLALDHDYGNLFTAPAGAKVAEKDGYLDDTHASAALVFLRSGPRIVVIVTYNQEDSLYAAQRLGQQVFELSRRL